MARSRVLVGIALIAFIPLVADVGCLPLMISRTHAPYPMHILECTETAMTVNGIQRPRALPLRILLGEAHWAGHLTLVEVLWRNDTDLDWVMGPDGQRFSVGSLDSHRKRTLEDVAASESFPLVQTVLVIDGAKTWRGVSLVPEVKTGREVVNLSIEPNMRNNWPQLWRDMTTGANRAEPRDGLVLPAHKEGILQLLFLASNYTRGEVSIELTADTQTLTWSARVEVESVERF